MSSRRAIFNTSCPSCRKNFQASTEVPEHRVGEVDVDTVCPHCNRDFRAEIPPHCLNANPKDECGHE